MSRFVKSENPCPTSIGWYIKSNHMEKCELHNALDYMSYSDKLSMDIEEMRNFPDSPRKKEIKGNLPYLVMGSYKDDVRKAENLIETRGMILDIDHLEDVEELKFLVSCDPRTHFCFISPSGDGLKVGFKFDRTISDVEEYKKIYRHFVSKFEEEYDVKLDNTPDPCRACFFSCDESIYYEPNPYPVTAIAPVEHEKPVVYNYTATNPEKTWKDAEEACKNGSPDGYQAWVECGFALKQEFGDAGLQLFKVLSLKGDYKDTERDIERKWKSFKNYGAVGIGTLFHHLR